MGNHDPAALTPRQLQCLRAIESYSQSRGYAPSAVEVAANIGVHASRASALFDTLARKGWITREPRVARGIRVVRPSADVAAPPKPTRRMVRRVSDVGNPMDDPIKRSAVEAVIHEAMRWERMESTPVWQDGNSLAEGRARQAAAAIAELLFGDSPAMAMGRAER
jgi:SOS-response transcriptional repressor LexA